MNIHDSIFETIEAHNLISTQDRLLVAVSGGIDSTVICHVLQDLGYQFDIAHVNFKLRGQASIHDFQFVEKLAQWFRCEFHATQVETKSYARDNKLTTQEAARIIRYDYFQKLVSEQHYDKVITAHHAGDNMETMLYNFIKGGTLSALRGIPLRRDYIIRPMLHTSKELIVQFAQHRQLSFCNDASNEDSKYSRNYIRKEIIPKLLILNPSLESTLNRTSHMGAGYESLIEQQIEAFKTNHVLQSENRLEVSLEELKSYASPLIILYHLAKSYGFSYINVEDIWTRYLNGNGTGKFFKNDQCRAVIDRKKLVIVEATKSDFATRIIHSIESSYDDSGGQIQIFNQPPVNPESRIEEVDKNKVHFPLSLRRWKEGDRFCPIGMKGKSKKIKKFLTDLKISRIDKERVLVLESKDEIIWVVGFRISEKIAVTAETKSLLFLQSKKP